MNQRTTTIELRDIFKLLRSNLGNFDFAAFELAEFDKFLRDLHPAQQQQLLEILADSLGIEIEQCGSIEDEDDDLD